MIAEGRLINVARTGDEEVWLIWNSFDPLILAIWKTIEKKII
jgi:hypothetical protein